MHRQHATFRQYPVHHGEDRLLDLPRIFGPGDNDAALLERQRDRGAGAHAIQRRIGMEMRCMQDDIVRLEPGQLLFRRPNEHVAREQRLPGARADQPYPHAECRIGPGVKILHEQVLPLQIGLHAALQNRELFRRQPLVDLAPPHVARDRRLIHHELVLHRPAGVHAGVHHQRAVPGQTPFIAAQRLRHQRGRRQVGVHGPRGMHACAGQCLGCQCFPRLVPRRRGLWFDVQSMFLPALRHHRGWVDFGRY